MCELRELHPSHPFPENQKERENILEARCVKRAPVSGLAPSKPAAHTSRPNTHLKSMRLRLFCSYARRRSKIFWSRGQLKVNLESWICIPPTSSHYPALIPSWVTLSVPTHFWVTSPSPHILPGPTTRSPHISWSHHLVPTHFLVTPIGPHTLPHPGR